MIFPIMHKICLQLKSLLKIFTCHITFRTFQVFIKLINLLVYGKESNFSTTEPNSQKRWIPKLANFLTKVKAMRWSHWFLDSLQPSRKKILLAGLPSTGRLPAGIGTFATFSSLRDLHSMRPTILHGRHS